MEERSEVADLETLERVRAGDKDAIAELWSIYQPQVLRLLRSKGAIAVDDVASQVWLDVRKAFHRFEGDGDAFRRWIFTIARRRAIDELRRVRRRGEVSSDTLAPEPLVIHANDRFDANAAVDRALALIRQLSPTAAEAVMLRIVYDMPVAEVAKITGQTESNVRVLVHRSLSLLRGIVEESSEAQSDERDAGGHLRAV